MSNPLLRPDDRFQRPALHTADGQNRFADAELSPGVAASQPGDANQAVDASPAGHAFAAPQGAAAGDAPYRPVFEQTMSHRGGLLLMLASLAVAGSVCMGFALFGWMQGWVFAVMGLAPAMIAAYLAGEDQKAIRAGAMDPRGAVPTAVALWMAWLSGLLTTGLFACLILWFVSDFWDLLNF